MAKPLGPKSLLIRDAVNAHPDMGNTELAEMINASPARKEDKLSVKPGEIAQQKQAMKKAGVLPAAAPAAKPARKKPGRKPGRKPAPAAPRVAAAASPVDLIDGVFGLARQCGGIGQLKRLVDRIAETQG